MDTTITIFRRYENLAPVFGGGNTINYMKVMTLMCVWQRLRPTEVIGGPNGSEVVSYIENVKATIPYNPVLLGESLNVGKGLGSTSDYFVEDTKGRRYKINNILNIDDRDNEMELNLSEWTKDGQMD